MNEDKSKILVVRKIPNTGEYSTIFDALQNATGNETVLIYDGIYEENHLALPRGITIRGIGDVEIRGYQVASSSPNDIYNFSTLECYNGATLENLKVTAKNLRYPIHADYSDGNAKWHVKNCTFIHYGNNEAYNYQVSLGESGTPNDIFNACSAFGSGTRGGDIVECFNCTFISTGRAFSTHNHYTDTYNLYGASHVHLENCTMISKGIDRDNSLFTLLAPLFVQSLNCPVDGCDVVVSNCKLNGYVVFQRSGGDGWSNKLKIYNSGKIKIGFNTYGSSGTLYVNGDQISTYQSYYDKYPQMDGIQSFVNRGNTSILKGRAVKTTLNGGIAAYDNITDEVFGVAMDDIDAGSVGNVCVDGYLPRIYFDGIRTTNIIEGDNIYVDSNGQFSLSGSKVVFIASDNQNVKIK